MGEVAQLSSSPIKTVIVGTQNMHYAEETDFFVIKFLGWSNGVYSGPTVGSVASDGANF